MDGFVPFLFYLVLSAVVCFWGGVRLVLFPTILPECNETLLHCLVPVLMCPLLQCLTSMFHLRGNCLNSWKLRAIKRAVWAAADPGLVPSLTPPICSTSLRYGSHMAAFDLCARIQGILILPVMSKVVSSIRTTSTLSLNYLFRDRKIRKASSKEGMSTYNGSVVAPKIIVFFLIV